uniref:Ig-like domain-containing protein n=1 Tax=Gopherus agassizii TaxID=38772 RepID=A0A452GMQ5_9SAUR
TTPLVPALLCLLQLGPGVSGGFAMGLKRPSISVSPSGVIVLGAAVTIRCQCQCEARKLFLYKDGIQIKELDAGARDEFTIPSARHTGSYSCQYGTKSDPPVWSHPSDPVELMVAGEEPAQYLCSVTGFPGWVCGTAGLSVPPTWGFSRNCDADVKLQTLAGPALTQPGCWFRPSPIPAVAHFSSPEGTDPAGPQQPDHPTTEPEGEGEREKWNNLSPREQGSWLRCRLGQSDRLEEDGPCRQNCWIQVVYTENDG